MNTPLHQDNDVSLNQAPCRHASTLVSKNVIVGKHRTSLRLEPAMWSGLKDIGRRERYTTHQICTAISQAKPKGTSLTAAVRVFIMAYFRSAATEDGHAKAGHGQGKLPPIVSLMDGQIAASLVPKPQPAPSFIIGNPVANGSAVRSV